MQQRIAAARVGAGSSSLTTRWPLVLSRTAVSRSAPLATRKQLFKEHIVQLQKKDPDRWTTRALAHHFRQPLANTAAALALQKLEAEAGALDEELVVLAEDAEEYLESEDDPDDLFAEDTQQEARRALPAAASSGDASSAASSIELDTLGADEEHALIEELATRFGADGAAPGVSASEALGAAVRAAIDALDEEALHALHAQLDGSGVPPPADGSDARRALLRLLTSDVPAPLLESDANGVTTDLRAVGLPPVPPELCAALSASA